MGKFGWQGVVSASGVIFFAYIGFDAISTASQEARNPQRDMPIGILASLVVCTVLYVVVAMVLTGMVSYKELDVAAPVALAFDKYPPLHWLGLPVKLGAIAGMTSVMLVMTLAQARIFFAMARDGLLPEWFSHVHPKYKTPSTGTAITAILAAIIGGLFPVNILGRAGVDRHAGGVRDRVHRRAGSAQDPTGFTTPVPCPAAMGYLPSWGCDLFRHDAFSGYSHLDTVTRMDGDRRRGLPGVRS